MGLVEYAKAKKITFAVSVQTASMGRMHGICKAYDNDEDVTNLKKGSGFCVCFMCIQLYVNVENDIAF